MPAPKNYPGLTRAGEGRPRGSQNRATQQMKDFIEKFLHSEAYRQSVQKRSLEGKAPHIEVLMWEHLYGKVRAQVGIEASVRPEPQVVVYLPAKNALPEASPRALPASEGEDGE